MADGTALSSGLAANFGDEPAPQLDGKHGLGFWNWERRSSFLGLLQVAISLPPRKAVVPDEPG